MGSNETPTRDAAMPADSEIEDGQADPEVQVAKQLVVTSEERKESEILELLRNDQVRTIVLKGEAGVGKTWIAEKISALAVREGLSYHMDWWVYLNQRDESKSLLDKIARQLSVEVTEQEKNAHQLSVEATKGEGNEKEGGIEEKRRKILGTKISAELVKRATELEVKRAAELAKVATKAEAKTPTELEVKKPAGKTKAKKSAQAKRPPAKPETEGSAEPSIEKSEANESAVPEKPPAAQPRKAKFLLLILDGLPDTTTEVDFMAQLKYLEKPNEGQQKLIEGPAYKVLITTRKKDVKDEGTRAVIEVKELKHESSLSLLSKSVDPDVGSTDSFGKRAAKIAKNSDFLPGPIVMIAKALNRIKEHDLEGALEKAAEREKGPDGVNPLLLCVLDMLPSEDEALINCWWHSYYFFQKQGGLHYDELIACWIVEGCLGDDVGVEKAYREGYRVLMELKDRGILNVQDDNIVVIGGLAPTRRNYHQDGYEKTTSLGLASAFDAADWQVFGRITLANGIIRAPWNDDKWEKVSTLITSGCPLPGKVHDLLFTEGRTGSPGPLEELQVLVLFSPTMDSLPQAFAKMKKLRLLVLRECDKLGNIDLVGELNSLEILEISGATSLKEMKDDFFNNLKNLRSLNLSDAQIISVPSSISHLVELRWLILRNLSCLHMVPRLSKLTKLEVLDIRGASQLGRFENKALKPLERLELLNVSKTKLERVPILGSLQNLSRLSLDGCESLPRSSKLGELSKLQVLNVSGNQELEEIPDESRNKKENLRILDLSKTTIRILPFNFDSFIRLERLDLSSTKITNLPSLSKLKDLEVLNLSDCPDLEKIEENSFENMTRLRCLNVSRTKIKSLGSLSNLVNLRRLLLKNCSSLEGRQSLESLSEESLSKLEELDLCGVTFPEGTEAGYLKFTTSLRRLDLSDTGLMLPSVCKLTNLTELSIRGCSHSKLKETSGKLEIVDLLLGASTKLEILDLSKTGISSLPSFEDLRALRELKLRDCLGLEQLPVLASPAHLEVLDLSGTRIGVPSQLSALTNLKHLDLPDSEGRTDFDWKSVAPPEELNWFESGIYKCSEKRPCMLLSRDELCKILEDDPELKPPCFQNFHFFVCPSKGQPMAGDIYSHRIHTSSRKLYFSRNDPFPDENGRVLEIVGFGEFPAGIDGAFKKAEYFSFIDNKFIESLSDVTVGLTEWGEEGLVMKGCILEKCDEMKTVFGKEETKEKADGKEDKAHGREVKAVGEKKPTAEEETKVMMVKNLEILSASNLVKLNCVFSANAQIQTFDQLRELYLDCCPVLKVVFESSDLPTGLKTLQIKFCANLERLFSQGIKAPELKNLEKLHLLELPELTSIGLRDPQSVLDIYLEGCPVLKAVFATSQLPKNLEILDIRFCNKLETLFPPNMEGQFQNLQKLHLEELTELQSIGLGDSSSIVDIFPSVKSIRVTGCPKIYSLEKIGSSKNLKELYLDQCPMLGALFASIQLPENLEILEIRSCNKLRTLFPTSTANPQLSKLQKLHLEELTELTSIGVGNSWGTVDIFPSVKSIRIMGCPKINSLEKIGSSKDLEELHLDRCWTLEAVFSSSHLPQNLEILEIRFCNKLKTLFPPKMEEQLQKFRKLHIEELTELTSIGLEDPLSNADVLPSVKSIRVMGCPKIQSLEKIGSFKYLEELYLDRCRVLEAVFSSSHLPEKLEILEIKFCYKLRTLFPPNMEGQFQNFQKLHIQGLTELTSIGLEDSSRNGDIFPSVKSIRVMGCPKIYSLEKIGSSKNLKELYLERCRTLELVFASSQLPGSLEILEIRYCNKLKTLFPPNMEGPLQNLQKLHLEELNELASVGLGDSASTVDTFPSVKSIRVMRCPKIQSLGKIVSSKDLEELYLDRCCMLEAVFASSQLPENLEILEIRYCNKLKTLFSRPMEGQLLKLQKLHLVELPELASIGNSRNIVDIFPSVKSIRVMGCPQIVSLETIKGSKDLEELCLDHCPTLKAVFASSQLPENLEILEIRFCNKLKRLFRPHMEGQLQKLKKLHLVELPELVDIGVTEATNVEDVFPSKPSIKVKNCPNLNNLEWLKQLPNASVENF